MHLSTNSLYLQVASEEVDSLKSLTKPLQSTSIVTLGVLKSHIETCSVASEATKPCNKNDDNKEITCEGREDEEEGSGRPEITAGAAATFNIVGVVVVVFAISTPRPRLLPPPAAALSPRMQLLSSCLYK